MMMDLTGKHITLGVTGSIAAYKSALLVRLFIKAGAEVQVVMTPSAKEFITPLTLSTLTDKPVLCDFFDHKSGSWNSHVSLGLWSDLMIIAPATASTLGKMAHGIADNLLITSYFSCRAPVMVAPAMDLDMFAHPSTQKSLDQLVEWGVHIVEPGVGEMASHLMGKGRMAEPQEIFEAACRLLAPAAQSSSLLAGKRMLITSGPTYEKIDPVRFIGNYSTGKMGRALAEEANRRGVEVYFVTGPVSVLPHGENIHIVEVESAEEMYEASAKVHSKCDLSIFCAAVADYKVADPKDYKIKREETGPMTIDLVPNPDIAALLGAEKSETQVHIGFALETNVTRVAVRDKMERKNLDMIVVNSLQDDGAGFGTDTNKVSILDINGMIDEDYPLLSKEETAVKILDQVERLLS